MKWYIIKCPRCGWQSGLVEKHVAEKFARVRVCQDCDAQGVKVSFDITEKATFARGGTT